MLAVGAVQAANLINNGGFESALSGWTASNTDLVPSATWAPSEGSFSLDLNGFEAGSISQDIDTTPGNSYTVLFDLAGNPGIPQNVKKFEISAAGDSAIYEFDTAGKSGATVTTMGWREESFTFTATDTTTTLLFKSLHNPGAHPDKAQGVALDDIRVTINLPTTKDQCKKGGWKEFGVFKHQGDCVSFVATNGKNSPSGS